MDFNVRCDDCGQNHDALKTITLTEAEILCTFYFVSLAFMSLSPSSDLTDRFKNSFEFFQNEGSIARMLLPVMIRFADQLPDERDMRKNSKQLFTTLLESYRNET